MVKLISPAIALAGILSTTHARSIINEDTAMIARGTNATDIADTPLSSSCIRYSVTGHEIPVPGSWVSAIAQKMYKEQQSSSCEILYEPQTVNGILIYTQIVPSSTNGDNCGSTAQLKTDRNGLVSAVNQLRQKSASSGCCRFQHGGGTYRADVRFRTSTSFAWDNIPCPSD